MILKGMDTMEWFPCPTKQLDGSILIDGNGRYGHCTNQVMQYNIEECNHFFPRLVFGIFSVERIGPDCIFTKLFRGGFVPETFP